MSLFELIFFEHKNFQDTPPQLYSAAEVNVLNHLKKLEKEKKIGNFQIHLLKYSFS